MIVKLCPLNSVQPPQVTSCHILAPALIVSFSKFTLFSVGPSDQGLNQIKVSEFETSCCKVQDLDHVVDAGALLAADFAPRRPSHLLTGPHLLLLSGGAQHRAQLWAAAGGGRGGPGGRVQGALAGHEEEEGQAVQLWGHQ